MIMLGRPRLPDGPGMFFLYITESGRRARYQHQKKSLPRMISGVEIEVGQREGKWSLLLKARRLAGKKTATPHRKSCPGTEPLDK